MKNIAFIANLKKAIHDRREITVAGGQFNWRELKDVLYALESAPELLRILEATAEQLAAWMEIADPEDVRQKDIDVLREARNVLRPAIAEISPSLTHKEKHENPTLQLADSCHRSNN